MEWWFTVYGSQVVVDCILALYANSLNFITVITRSGYSNQSIYTPAPFPQTPTSIFNTPTIFTTATPNSASAALSV